MAAVFAHGSEVLMVAGTQALGGTQVDATPLRSVSALSYFSLSSALRLLSSSVSTGVHP